MWRICKAPVRKVWPRHLAMRFLLAIMFSLQAMATEKALYFGSQGTNDYDAANSIAQYAAIDDNFMTYIGDTSGDATWQFVLDKAYSLKSMFVGMDHDNSATKSGTFSIYVTNDATDFDPPSSDLCVAEFFDTGFYPFLSTCPSGKYVLLKRVGGD